MKKVVIIGAGPGGLAAAMLAARAGHRVTLIEQLEHVGGRTSLIRGDGFTFDTGPTFFLYPDILREIFAACDYTFDDEVDLIRIDPQYRLVFGQGGSLLATPQVELMDRRIGELAPVDRGAFARFMDENRRKFDHISPALQRPFSRLSDALKWDMIKMFPTVRPHQNLYSYLQRFFKDERTLLTFSFQSKYLGMSPWSCPSLFSILAFLEYEFGVFHPRGGCGAVSETMARLARDMGVDIHLGETARQITVHNRTATGVVTDRATYEADAVINNADFAHSTMKLIAPEHRRKWTDRRITRRRYSCSCFMVYLGIEGPVEGPLHHNIFFSDEYKQNLADIESNFRLHENPSMYVQNATPTDPSLAPEGMSTLYLLIPVPHCHPGIDWPQARDHYRSVAFRQLKKLGVEDIEPRIRFEKIVTPDDWRDWQQVHLGATFNMAHSLRQMLSFRPHNRFDDLRQLYLVGGGTHPGSGLPVIYESARISTRLMLEDFGQSTDWLEPGPLVT
ncbi:MAG: phytoene desaturase family protein [Planctomycetota bacterium]